MFKCASILVKSILCLSSLLLVCTSSHAELSIKLGEERSLDYSGIHFPTFDDELLLERYFVSTFGDSLFDLKDFFAKKLPTEPYCSSDELAKREDYIRYLFRLIALSYNYELLLRYDYAAADTNIKSIQSACELDWKSLIASCQPASKDMKVYIDRLRGIFEREASVPGNPWITLQDRKRSNLKIKNSELKKLCERERQNFSKICSEGDSLYGMSKLALMGSLIEQSHVITLLGGNEQGHACLKRFSDSFESQEPAFFPFASSFESLAQELKNDPKVRYPQGRLFLPGALREFDEKGLGDMLYARVEAPKPVPVKVVTPQPVVIVQAPPPVIAAPPKKEEAPLPPPPKKEEIKRSAFFFATEERIQKNLPSIDVDMVKFKKDFEMDNEKKAHMEKLLGNFQTREALLSMKKLDSLGTFKEPVRLLFVKFLIDTEKHQGLYNIQAVIGKEFWMLNDVDDISDPKPVYVELFNNKESHFMWQLRIKRDPN